MTATAITLSMKGQFALSKAKLVRSKDGFLVFRAPKGAPRISRNMVKKLESETV
jgi:hypothetical protein